MSIIHRITGVAMFVEIPVLIYLLDLSLRDAASYQAAGEMVRSPLGVILLFGLMWGISHHLLAGIRYLLIDVHMGVEKETDLRATLSMGVI